jgi:predicted NBD/HSP70 family sugar kinase
MQGDHAGEQTREVCHGRGCEGTKIAAGIVTSEGEILTQSRVPMIADGDATAGLGAVQAAVDSLFAGRPASIDPPLGVCQGRFSAAFCD